jgi:hypothetical protein
MHKYYVLECNMGGWAHVGKMADIFPYPTGGTSRRLAESSAARAAEWQSQFDDQSGICYLVVQVAKSWGCGRVVAQFNS